MLPKLYRICKLNSLIVNLKEGVFGESKRDVQRDA